MTVLQRRLVFWGVPGLLLAVALVFSFRPQAVSVDFAQASRGPLIVTVDEEGETRVRDVFVLSSPVTGRARRIEAEVGDRVVGGETVLVFIEPIDPELLDSRSASEARAEVQAAEAALTLARAELAKAEADFAFARSELRRQQGLQERGAVSQRDLDSAERSFGTNRAAVDTARAAIQRSSFDLDRARARLVSPADGAPEAGAEGGRYLSVRSPVSGAVLQVLHESAGVVQAGEALIEIGDPRELEIMVDLLSADAVRTEPGQRVLIEEWGGDGVLQGRVRRVEPYGFTKVSALGIEEQRVNVLIDLVDPPERWQRLGHGYRVEARIVLWEREDVLKLPLSALFRDGEDWSVFLVDDGRATTSHVTTGRHNGLEVEITGGLEVGAPVVRYPSEQVVDGARVSQRE